jgi:ubiquinone/menaquinone biosynthesis C-methylase UbiE
MREKDYLQVIQSILHDSDRTISPQAYILDFGCGKGHTVNFLRNQGYTAFGVDIGHEEDWQQYPDPSFFALLDMSDYHIPFTDNTFDLILSWQVFEHVQNYDQVLGELYRVLKPSGMCLHIFPSRWRLLEAHVFVPFAGVFQSFPYLAFFALLGIRNSYQKGLSWQETAKRNTNYLHNFTNYLSRKQIMQKVKVYFGNLQFVESSFIRYSLGRTRWLRFFPGIARVYSTFWTRVILFTKASDGAK